jgi:hypothetical protein
VRNLKDGIKREGSARATALAVVGLIALGLGGFVRPAFAQGAQKDGTARGTPPTSVAEAKARGVDEITVNPIKERFTGLPNPWSAVLAEPMASVTVRGDIGLYTFYTFRIEEFLRRQAAVPDPTAEYRAPSGIEPPRAGQFLVAVSGGDLRIQGVMVHQLGVRFEIGAKYVLIVLLRGGDNVSRLPHPAAALAVGPVGTLTPLRYATFPFNVPSAGVNDLGHLRELLREPTR